MAHFVSMNPLEVFVKEHLLFVHTKAEAGEYADAMAALQETKASTSNNVYIRALERQLGNLLDLSRQNVLTEERKLEILEPMSGIIERVLGSLPTIQREQSSVQTNNPSHAGPVLTAEEKAEALEKLKVQYFEQAAIHLSAGEYGLALGEIRRVFVIDADNSTALQYESVILELVKLKGSPPNPSTMPATSRELMHEYERRIERVSPLDDRMKPAFQPESSAPAEFQEPVAPEHATGRDEKLEPAPSRFVPPTEEVPDAEPYRLTQPAPAETYSEEPVVFSHERNTTTVQRRKSSRVLLFAAIAITVTLVAVITVIALSSRSSDQVSFSSLSQGTATTAVEEQSVLTKGATRGPANDKAASLQNLPVASTSRSQTPLTELPTSQQKENASLKGSTDEGSSQSSNSRAPVHSAPIVPVVSEDALTMPTHRESTSQPAQNLASSTEAQSLTIAEPEPEPFIAVEREPQLVKLASPQISDIAWQTGSEAKVVVRIMIDADGKPVQTRVLKSNNTIVENAVVAALMKSTFTPGIMGKTPVASWVTVPLKFKRGD